MKKVIMLAAASAMMAGMMATSAMASDGIDASKIYSSKCKMCHSFDKKKVGPAFSQMNTDPAILGEKITKGKKMMPKFGKKLSSDEIDAMVEFIQSKQAPVKEADCGCKEEDK